MAAQETLTRGLANVGWGERRLESRYFKLNKFEPPCVWYARLAPAGMRRALERLSLEFYFQTVRCADRRERTARPDFGAAVCHSIARICLFFAGPSNFVMFEVPSPDHARARQTLLSQSALEGAPDRVKCRLRVHRRRRSPLHLSECPCLPLELTHEAPRELACAFEGRHIHPQ